MSYNHLLDQGIDPDDWEPTPLNKADREWIAWFDAQYARISQMTTYAIQEEADRAYAHPSDDAYDIYCICDAELRKRGVVKPSNDGDPAF